MFIILNFPHPPFCLMVYSLFAFGNLLILNDNKAWLLISVLLCRYIVTSKYPFLIMFATRRVMSLPTATWAMLPRCRRARFR